jgi:glycosyltransferase involved in cell wall biosynthesis
LGAVANKDLPEIYQQAHLLFSGDINAACPNSVIESIACGTPVLAFDTGALREILGDNAGLVVPYGGNPWKIDAPDISSLVEAAMILLEDNDTYRTSARGRAVAEFGLSNMVDHYLEVLLS